jgi:hypothetical protein
MLRSRKGALSPKSLRSPSAVVLEAQTAAPWTGGHLFALGSARIPECCSRHPAGNVREHDQYRLSPRSRGSGSCKLCAASMERASPAGDCPPRPATPKPSARCRRRHAGSARSPLTSEHRGGEVRLCCHQKKLGTARIPACCFRHPAGNVGGRLQVRGSRIAPDSPLTPRSGGLCFKHNRRRAAEPKATRRLQPFASPSAPLRFGREPIRSRRVSTRRDAPQCPPGAIPATHPRRLWPP